MVRFQGIMIGFPVWRWPMATIAAALDRTWFYLFSLFDESLWQQCPSPSTEGGIWYGTRL